MRFTLSKNIACISSESASDIIGSIPSGNIKNIIEQSYASSSRGSARAINSIKDPKDIKKMVERDILSSSFCQPIPTIQEAKKIIDSAPYFQRFLGSSELFHSIKNFLFLLPDGNDNQTGQNIPEIIFSQNNIDNIRLVWFDGLGQNKNYLWTLGIDIYVPCRKMDNSIVFTSAHYTNKQGKKSYMGAEKMYFGQQFLPALWLSLKNFKLEGLPRNPTFINQPFNLKIWENKIETTQFNTRANLFRILTKDPVINPALPFFEEYLIRYPNFPSGKSDGTTSLSDLVKKYGWYSGAKVSGTQNSPGTIGSTYIQNTDEWKKGEKAKDSAIHCLRSFLKPLIKETRDPSKIKTIGNELINLCVRSFEQGKHEGIDKEDLKNIINKKIRPLLKRLSQMKILCALQILLIKISNDRVIRNYLHLVEYILNHQRDINAKRFDLYRLLPQTEAYLVAYFTNNVKEADVIKYYSEYNASNLIKYSFFRPFKDMHTNLPDETKEFIKFFANKYGQKTLIQKESPAFNKLRKMTIADLKKQFNNNEKLIKRDPLNLLQGG